MATIETIEVIARRPTTDTGGKGKLEFNCPCCGHFCKFLGTLSRGKCDMCLTRFGPSGAFEVEETEGMAKDIELTLELQYKEPGLDGISD